MMKNWENNGTEEIGLVTPTPDRVICPIIWLLYDDTWQPLRWDNISQHM